MTPETLHHRLESAMHDAMRARDEQRTQTLRMALAAAQNQRIAKRRDLTDEEVTDVLTKQVKQRRESIAMFRDAGREDRASAEEAEAAILAEFLPEQLSEEEVERMARATIAETGASGPGDMGRVMGRLSAGTKGRADGRQVSEVVRRLLGG
ncbi:MAG TPA: GatB/YqeY domain-containing protein [Vitreimonas sp.]|jgi:uncharacterized protein|nr:GatB/YqeY domain-containing protein [Vitreimonas sp.]